MEVVVLEKEVGIHGDCVLRIADGVVELDYSVEQVLSAALHAYAQYLFDEMVANGELEK